MSDDTIELTGRRVPALPPRQTRNVVIHSRVLERRDVILSILDAAYKRDVGGTRGVS